MSDIRERIKTNSTIDPETGCWMWSRSTDKDGYGLTKYERKTVRAHRLSYLLFVGPIPEGLVLDHFKCDNKGCVNPQHLRPVSQRENLLRGGTVASKNRAKSECSKGHPLEGENVYEWNGYRQCRECGRTKSREYQRRRRNGD